MELSGILSGLGWLDLSLAGAILFLAYFVRGITGFGSALVAVPLLLFLLPFKVVIPLIVAMDNIASTMHGINQRHHICWQDIFPLLPFTLAGVLSALYIMQTIDASLLLNTLGGFVIAYAVYTLLPIQLHRGHSRAWAVPAGGLGGLIGTLFATGGPFYVIYLKLRGLDKKSFRPTIATIFVIDGSMRLLGFVFAGFYTGGLLLVLVISLPVMILAMYVGGHVHTSLSQETFQRIISILLIMSGMGLILK